MNRAWKKIVVGFLLIVSISFTVSNCARKTTYEGKISDPVQVDFKKAKPIKHEGKKGPVEIYPRAKYEITAMVKSKKRYVDYASRISKYDLVMGWGEVNQKEIDENVKYSQVGRWYRCDKTDMILTTYEYLGKHTANVHIIHKDKTVLKEIKKVKEGDLIKMKGLLVDVDFNEPGVSLWSTSLTRDDTGGGACEIMYVEEVKFLDK